MMGRSLRGGGWIGLECSIFSVIQLFALLSFMINLAFVRKLLILSQSKYVNFCLLFVFKVTFYFHIIIIIQLYQNVIFHVTVSFKCGKNIHTSKICLHINAVCYFFPKQLDLSKLCVYVSAETTLMFSKIDEDAHY